MNLIPDSVDLSAYLPGSDIAARVRRAGDFRGALLRAFAAPEQAGPQAPRMTSTKLGGVLEFRPGEVTVWAGYNGHRKSLLTGQVALDLCAQGERVLMASFEMVPAATLARMARQASGERYPAPVWIERFARWTDDRLWMFDHFGRITPERCIAALRYFAHELRGTQAFVDSVMMVCESEERLDEQKRFIGDAIRAAQEHAMHVHVIAHCRKPAQGGDERPPSKYDVRGSAAISDQASNLVTVWENKAKRAGLAKGPGDPAYEEAWPKPDAAVTVEKQREGAFEGRLALFWHPPSLRFVDYQSAEVPPYPLLP